MPPPTHHQAGEATIVTGTGPIRSAASCAHKRLIDDVRTRSGKGTGKVRCLECRAEFDDPRAHDGHDGIDGR